MNKAYEKYGYNTYFGAEKGTIEKYLTNFDDFIDLLEIRRNLKNSNSELGNFYILNGKYHIDQFAQIGKITDGLDELKSQIDIPLVVTDDEFRSFMKQYNTKMNCITSEEIDRIGWDQVRIEHDKWKRPYSISISTSFSASLPEKNTICPYCGKGWNLDNVDDCLQHNSQIKSFPVKEFDLHGDILWDFIGQPIKNMWKFFKIRTNAIYRPITDCGVSNPKWVDNTPDPEYKTLQINPNGFYGGRHYKIDDNYICQESDEINFWVIKCFHKDCNRKFLNEHELEKFEECFSKAGYTDIEITPIPNEYCHDIYNCTMCADWLNVKTKWGVIKIGWRKRVINIDWSGCKIIPDVNVIFKNEDVTKGEDFIHAWGWEKCTDYLTSLREGMEKYLKQ